MTGRLPGRGGGRPTTGDAEGRAGGPDLRLAGTVRRGSFVLDVDLAVAGGEVLAVVGPNGAGKSTLLRAVAGLEALDTGRLTLGDQVLDDAAARAFVPPAGREVGTVFQDHRLFPHLTAAANVAFGPRARGADRAHADATAHDWLERLGVAHLATRRPGELSGGQAQRVALARTLAAGPRALVLDEPLAALDPRARADVHRALAEHLAPFGGPCVVVTHDVVDALVLADRLVVLEDGRVVQEGAPGDVVRRPATPYVAHLLGLNLCTGPVPFPVVAPDGTPLAPGDLRATGLRVAVRPSAVRLLPADGGDGGGGGGGTARWSGTVGAVGTRGEHVRVEVDADPPAVVETTAADLPAHVRPGARVRLEVDPAGVETYAAV